MIAALLVAAVALVGMVSSGPRTPARDQDPDIASGEYRFGRFLGVFTLIAALVLLAVVVAGVLSMAGVFDKDYIDPPV